MIRSANLDITLDFFINKLGLNEVRRYENKEGKFTLVFLCAPNDMKHSLKYQAPLIEITYNWYDKKNNNNQKLEAGRAFGHIAFRVDDIYKICDKLIKEGVKINRPPRDGYMAFIKSPDNISIELLQKGTPLKPREPWKNMPNTGDW
tara:strand:- start:11596 stop:12036 length:441 start_codon:yes stop_codon:yes gene_type:complete